MADLCPLTPYPRRRPSVDAQLAALAPFPFPRTRAAPWQLNRAPYDFPELTEFGWLRPRELELGEELEGAEPAAGAAASPAARAAAAARAPALLACPETVTYVGRLFASPQGPLQTLVTLGTIPAPCRIIDCVVYQFDAAALDRFEWNLLVLDTPITATVARGTGEKLMQPSFTPLATLDFGGYGMPCFNNALATGDRAPIHAGPIGRLLTQGGYLAFGVSEVDPAGTGGSVACLVTLELCGSTAARAVPTARQVQSQVTARAAAAPRAPVAPRAPAAPPSPPAPRGHTSSGAFPVMAGVGAEGIVVQRWALPDQPGRTFATLAEAEVAWRVAQIAALPTAQRPAAQREAAIAASHLRYGTAEIATPAVTLLAPRAAPRVPGITAPAIRRDL